MIETSRSSKYFLALLVAGVALTGCNRNTDEAGQESPPPNTAPAAPMTPPADSAPPPAAAPDSSSAAPPADSGSAAGTASDMASKAGDAVEDSVITAKVKAALLADSSVKGTDINVETSQGNVTLSGNVDSQAQIDSALRITQGINGVKNVDNKLAAKAG